MENKHQEAPVSLNTKIKSPNGFEHQLTLRQGITEKDFADFMTLVVEKENVLLKKGWTALPIHGGFGKKEAKPVEYVIGRACPKDNARLVVGQGKVKERCENNKYDYTLKKNIGSCDYLVWN